MVKKLLLAVLLPIPIAVVIVSCDSSPSTGSWIPVQEIHDLSGVDIHTACWLEDGVYPCLDGGTD